VKSVTDGVMAICVLVLAILLDLILGDPSPNSPEKYAFRFHPTVLMGKFTKALEPYFKSPNPKKAKLKGAILALAVILVFSLPVYFGLWAIQTFISYLIYSFFAIVLLKLTICIKLETDWAKAAAEAISLGDLEEAKKYAHFSRREAKDLTGEQISSAVIESMAENLIDFRLSPILSYAFFGVTGAIAFRTINTLDGTVGFKDPEHLHTGWFSANLDTIINYIPARLTAILIIVGSALLDKDYKKAWAIARRDHGKTPSRNHGWPMAAMAGALGVQLEKPDQYILGEQTETLSPDKILHAVKIRNMAIVLCVLLSLPIIWLTRSYFLLY